MGGCHVAAALLGLAAAAHAAAQPHSPPGGDAAVVKRRLVAEMLPVLNQQAAAVKAAEALAATLLPNGTFPDINYHEFRRAGWPMVAHLGRVSTMAAAWRGANNGSATPTLAPLLSKTLSALDVWLTKDWKNPNWYDNEIGVPRQMGNIGLLLQPALSAADATKMTEIMARADWKGSGTVSHPKWTGANLLDMLKIQIHRGVFANDSNALAQVISRAFPFLLNTRNSELREFLLKWPLSQVKQRY